MKTYSHGVIKLSFLFELLICVFYTWYVLPVCQALLWTNTYKILFFMCFAVGTVGLACLHGFRINGVIVPVLAYMLVFAVLYLFGVDDANAHIRISFTFWGTALLYFGVLQDEERIRIGKYLLILFVFTAITSSYGVITDNSAARTVAYAGADDQMQTAYKLKNIANVYLFQMLVMSTPILMIAPKTRKMKAVSLVLMVAIAAVLLNASFTISLIMYIVAILLSVIVKTERKQRGLVVLVIAIPVFLILINGQAVLAFLADIVGNEKIAARLQGLRNLIYIGGQEDSVSLRWDLYMASLETFLENPFGIGAHYTYRRFDGGMGYHSQFIDDLARYGIAALAFYAVFLTTYYKHLKQQWQRHGYPQIAAAVVIVYALFLVLNLGFRSAEESIMVLFIMPAFPLLIESWKKKKGALSERSNT